MARITKSEKIVEIHEVYVIRQTSGSLPELCSDCTTDAGPMVTAEHAAAIAAVPVRIIYVWVKSEVVHYKHGQNGSLWVCVKSLPINLISE